MLESLGEVLSRHGKMIFAVMIVALLILIPPASNALERTGFGIQDLADEGSGSDIASGIVSSYFDKADVDISGIPMIVVSYDSNYGYEQLQGNVYDDVPCFSDYLSKMFMLDPEWSAKLDVSKGCSHLLRTYGDEESGALLIGLFYNDSMTGDEIRDDTGNLREKVAYIIDEYMFDIYDRERCFDVKITGGDVLTYDIRDEMLETASVLVPAIIVIVLILMGLFFGSIMTAMTTAASMVFSIVFTLAAIFGLSSMFDIYFITAILSLIIATIMSLLNCTLTVNRYKIGLESGMSADEALADAVSKSALPIIGASATIVAFGIALLTTGISLIVGLGICLISAAVIAMIVSFTIPACMIRITNNELFWTHSYDGTLRFASTQKASDKVKSVIGHLSKPFRVDGKAYVRAILVAVILLVSGGCAVIMFNEASYDDISFDLTDGITTGDSKDGLMILDEYGDGGLIHPYKIVLEYDEPVAYIVNIEPSSPVPNYGLIWTSDTVSKDVSYLKSGITELDGVSLTSSIFIWNDKVAEAKDAGMTTSDEIMDYILDNENDWLTYDALYNVLTVLRAAFDADEIVSDYGSRIDYRVNTSLGYIGYELLSDKRIAVTHIMIMAVSEDNTTSNAGWALTENLIGLVSEYRTECLEAGYIGGIGVVFDELMISLEKAFMPTLMYAAIAIIIAMMIVTISLLVPFVSLFMTAVGCIISFALVAYSTSYIGLGTISFITVLMVPIGAIGFGTWFNLVQLNELRITGSLKTMEKHTMAPVAMSCIFLVVSFFILSFSDMPLIGQLGFSLMIVVILDVVLVRFILSPLIWGLTGNILYKKAEKPDIGPNH